MHRRKHMRIHSIEGLNNQPERRAKAAEMGRSEENRARTKKMMEERQRRDRKTREQNGEEWEPTHFHKNPEEDGGHIWVYSGDYWEQREKKLEKLREGEDVSELLNGGNSKSMACDFLSYEEDL